MFYQSAEHPGFKKVTLLGHLLLNLLRCRPTFHGLRGILLGHKFGSSREVGGIGQRTRTLEPSLNQSSHTYAHTLSDIRRHARAHTQLVNMHTAGQSRQTTIMPLHRPTAFC